MAVPNWNLQFHIDKRTPFTIGEIYRCILAHLTEKEIKKALLKYRDLMPRNSDWNRKLTQATDIPEIGFRYLYRCGQIDESNHKTMQKMLKYVDRLDVLPFFDTLLYDSSLDNKTLSLLKAYLVNSEHALLSQLAQSQSYKQVFSEPYVLHKLHPPLGGRKTRSWAKRRLCDASTSSASSKVKSSTSPEGGSGKTKRARLSDLLTLPYIELLHGSSQYSASNTTLPMMVCPEKENILDRQKRIRQTAPWLYYNWAAAEDLDLTRGVNHLVHQLFNDAFLEATHVPLHPVIDKVNNDPIPKAVSPVTPFGHFSTHHVTMTVRIHMDINNLRPIMLTAFSHLNQLYEAQMEMYRDTVEAFSDRQHHGLSCLVTFSSLEHLDLFWHYYCAGHLENAIYRLLNKELNEYSWKETIRSIPVRYKMEERDYQLLSQSVYRGPLMKVFIQEEDYKFARCVLLNKLRRQWAPEIVPPTSTSPSAAQEETSESSSAPRKSASSRQPGSPHNPGQSSPVTRAASAERQEQPPAPQPQQPPEVPPTMPTINDTSQIPTNVANATKPEVDDLTFHYKEVPLGPNLDERTLMELYRIKGLDHPWFTTESPLDESSMNTEYLQSVTYLYRSMNPLSESNAVADHVFPWLVNS